LVSFTGNKDAGHRHLYWLIGDIDTAISRRADTRGDAFTMTIDGKRCRGHDRQHRGSVQPGLGQARAAHAGTGHRAYDPEQQSYCPGQQAGPPVNQTAPAVPARITRTRTTCHTAEPSSPGDLRRQPG
jgi:hypothetical protein